MCPTPKSRSNSRVHMRPHDLDYPVLIAVIGMSPAILTETAWALAHERPAIRPRKVIAFCTVRSRDQVRRELLDSGVWEALRRTLNAQPDELEFGDTGYHIRVITRSTTELPDIRTPEDSAATADFLLEQLRSFVENPEARVIASIAGGRKTMGALLYGCMTLIGREHDRITHVLVDEALEKRREPKFYFPQNAAEARGIHLADLPFVPLRNRFADLGRMPGSFLSLVAQYSRQLALDRPRPARLRFDDRRLFVTVDGTKVRLSPRAYVTLRFAVELNRTRQVPVGLDVSEEDLRNFITKLGLATNWLTTLNVKLDLRHELGEIRRAFRMAGLSWMPGLRRDALRLPPFIVEEPRS